MKLIFFELLVIYICGVYAKIHRLNKRQICSDLRTLGKCNSDCPCTQSKFKILIKNYVNCIIFKIYIIKANQITNIIDITIYKIKN